ncbi:MAG: DoxX family protein [Propionibacteriaceae bacterium]|nr:DoxX family protein [Propionibacteriaceae bacterium]
MPKFEFDQLQPWITLLARLILGGVLFYAGIQKVGNFDASILAVRRFQILPFELTTLAGIALPIIEITIGLLLITGTFTRLAALAGTALMVAFIIGIISVWVRGISIDCGCFGSGAEVDASETTYLEDTLRDVGLLACGVWAMWKPKSKLALDQFLFVDPIEPVELEEEVADD